MNTRRGSYSTHLPHEKCGKFQRKPSYRKIEGISIPLNVRVYYRIRCSTHGCKEQLDGSYLETPCEFIRRALSTGWAYGRKGNLYCLAHTLDACTEQENR